MKERATELEFLKWFWASADLWPADGDVRDAMAESFIRETGKNLPEGYNVLSDGITPTDQ